MANDETAKQDTKETTTFAKGMTFDSMLKKFDTKLTQEKSKAFEQKFGAKFKELDNAEAIAEGIRKELEKMFVEFNEGL